MYYSKVVLNNVRFHKKNTTYIVDALKERNIAWSRCGISVDFDTNLTNIIEILKELGFLVVDAGDYVYLHSFNSKNINTMDIFYHIGMFFENCTIQYYDRTNILKVTQIIDDNVVKIEIEEDLYG